MYRFILKRLFWLIIVVVCVAIFIFTLMYFTPGDPAEIILGQGATPEELEIKRESMGLNDPYIVQLGRFMSDLFLHFDLGTSYMRGTSVMEELGQRFPRTIALALISMFIMIIVGIPLGVISAVKQKSVFDRASMIIALVLIAIPSFWLALMMILLFSLKLNWLPASGFESLASFIMPCIAIALPGIAALMRQSRSAMLDVIRSDYIVTARSKGLTENEITFRYALPNAMIPILTMVGARLADCLGGAVVIETVFSIPGIGMLVSTAISQRDYPVVRGSVVVLAIVFSVIMLLVDIAYAYADPRIKAQFENQSVRKRRIRV